MDAALVNFDNSAKNLAALAAAWTAFVSGLPFDQNVIRPLILSSWRRSKVAAVDPYDSFGRELAASQSKSNDLTYEDLVAAFGTVIPLIEEILVKNQLSLQLFDLNARNVQLGSLTNRTALKRYTDIESTMLANLSEKVLGTNAVCLAIQENRPVQVVGAEHYNYYLHKFFCCSAPIHDPQGAIIGALNLFSSIDNYFFGAIGLASCLASIFDNRALIQTALEEVDIYEMAINNIMDHSAKGVIYVGNDNRAKYHNRTVRALLNTQQEEKDRDVVEKFLSGSRCLLARENVESREIIFNHGGTKKSLLVSSQGLVNSNNEPKGKLIFVEDTDTVYKSFQKIRGNKAHYTFDDIVGDNGEVLAAKGLALKIAGTRASVLIHGESGTGKEVFAQAIHNASNRKPFPFVSINCGAIPPELIESELFGYVAGAFTGALKGGKPGKLELASGGTLFLDEVESMPLNAQIKLLRALSTQKISRIGSIEEIPVDVRVISATKTDLLAEADAGNFREDLYYRISTILIKLPPLRERVADIAALTAHLVRLHGKEKEYRLSADFVMALSRMPWRGNIRELSNVVERAIALAEGDQLLTTNLLPEAESPNARSGGLSVEQELELRVAEVDGEGASDLLKTAEAIAIRLALRKSGGNVAGAARVLGISKPTLYTKIRQLDM